MAAKEKHYSQGSKKSEYLDQKISQDYRKCKSTSMFQRQHLVIISALAHSSHKDPGRQTKQPLQALQRREAKQDRQR